MDEKWKKKWLEALRSGEYEQCTGNLHLKDDGFCCLGVLCDLVGGDRWKDYGEGWKNNAMTFISIHDPDEYSYIPSSIVEVVGLTSGDPVVKDSSNYEATLSSLNDSDYGFDEIADIIEEQL